MWLLCSLSDLGLTDDGAGSNASNLITAQQQGIGLKSGHEIFQRHTATNGKGKALIATTPLA